MRHGMVEPSANSKPRLTLLGHGIAGLMAGPTRFAEIDALVLCKTPFAETTVSLKF